MRNRQKRAHRLSKFFKSLGPGLVTGASDDDPSGIATYSQAGAGFGMSTLWMALISFPLMAAIQGMCARIGLVTQHGLAVTLRRHYPKTLVYVVLLLSVPAISFNIGADIHAMGAVSNMLLPAVPASVFSVVFTILLTVIIIRFSYHKISQYLKWLCLSLLLYFIVPFLVVSDWSAVLKHSFLPVLRWDAAFISIIVALLGTTISPYLFFWQATMEAEDMNHHQKKLVVNKRILQNMRTDVNLGMFLSNVVMYFIILTTATVLFSSGIRNIETVEEAASALQPLAGRFCYLLFSMGILGTGFLAIPVLAGAQSYMLAEIFDWKAGLDKKFSQARPFYFTIVLSLLVGLSLDFFRISAVQALLYTAVLYGLTAPVLIAVVMHIGNNKKIMGRYTNSLLSNLLGGITLVVMTAAAVALIFLQLKDFFR